MSLILQQINQLFEDIHLAIKQQKYANAMILLRIAGEQWTILLCERQQITSRHLHQRERLRFLQQQALIDFKTLRFLRKLQSTGNRAVHQLQANPHQVIYYLTHLERYVSRYQQSTYMYS